MFNYHRRQQRRKKKRQTWKSRGRPWGLNFSSREHFIRLCNLCALTSILESCFFFYFNRKILQRNSNGRAHGARVGIFNVKCICKDNLLHFFRCIIEPRCCFCYKWIGGKIYTTLKAAADDDWLASLQAALSKVEVKSRCAYCLWILIRQR